MKSIRRESLILIILIIHAALLAANAGVVFGVSDPQTRIQWSSVLRLVIGLSAVAGLYGAYRRALPSQARFWGWMALAVGCWMLGDISWFVIDAVLGMDPTPSLADFFYLAQYPLMLVAVLHLPKQGRSSITWWKSALDLLMIVTALGLAGWNLLEPVWAAAAELPLLNRLLTVVYPFCDLLLVWMVWETLYRLTGQPFSAPVTLLAGAMLTTAAADMLFLVQDWNGTYRAGAPLDVLFSLAFFLYGCAGLATARRAFGDLPSSAFTADAPLDAAMGARWQVYIPYLWVVGAFVMLVLRIDTLQGASMHILLGGFGVIVGAVALRQILALRENHVLYGRLHTAHTHAQAQAAALERANRELQAEILVRQHSEQQRTHEALHDALTGLANRVLLLDRLQQAAKKYQRQASYCCSVLFLDLDGFKTINDSLGHAAGDRLLQIVAGRLVETVRATDTVARLGGDEFVLLLEEDDAPVDSALAARRILAALQEPLFFDGSRLFLSASIGIVPNAGQYERADDALRDADLAMYQAKTRGKSCFALYDAAMRDQIVERMVLENDLRLGLERGEFLLYYQPIFSLEDQRLVGFEALARWQHPQRGLVEPAQFIPLAEQTGLIIPLGRWVLNEACRQAAVWQNLRHAGEEPPLRVSVNVSGRQLEQPGFVDEVCAALRDHQLPGCCLALEVTESVCVNNTPALIAELGALQALGIEIQIDDFGTGYSSLSYLQNLPVQMIKIDKSFVQAIRSGERSPEILRAILSIADDLGIDTVAEGIETERQARALAELHCAYAQGYWLGRPVDARRAENWVIAARLPISAD